MAAVSNNVLNQPREWITPEEQLNRFRLSYPLISRISESKVFPENYNQDTRLSIADIISGYAGLPSAWTNWHTALKRIDMLPDSIPALPRNITQILDSKCPIYNGQTSLKESGVLYLTPAGTLAGLIGNAFVYGERTFATNPFTFQFEEVLDREERDRYMNLRSNDFEWVWLSKDVLPGSQNEPYQEQAERVAKLSEKALEKYEIPTAFDVTTVCFLHLVATGKRLYPNNRPVLNGFGYTGSHTRVQERQTRGNGHLTVGGFHWTGLSVSTDQFNRLSLGMSVVRRF